MIGRMKIPEKFPQFAETAFMLVTSKQEAALYSIRGKELEEIARFEVERPENTDKEGEFKTRSGGAAMRSGSVLERKDDALIRDFTSGMNRLVKETLINAEGDMYVFAPASVKSHVEKILSGGNTQKLDIHFFEGNYMHNHAFDLLQMIADVRGARRVVPTDPEAERILNLEALG